MDIAIIGGGAAGLAAALAARAKGINIRISLLEKNERVGRKLQSTGNGRCNLSNADMDARFFHSQTPEIVARVLQNCTLAEITAFFADIGLPFSREGTRLYPYSQRASAVSDVLRLALERLGVTTLSQTGVKAIEPGPDGFILRTQSGEKYAAARVIIATGGLAAPFTGSDGDGLRFLEAAGHPIVSPFPALTPLVVAHSALRELKGVRVKPCRLSLWRRGREVAADIGEVQFTEYGLSGIPAMQVSGAAADGAGMEVRLDLLPHMSVMEVTSLIQRRKTLFSTYSPEYFFTGLWHKSIGRALLREAGADFSQLAVRIKGWPFRLTGTKGYAMAQVTGGGASLVAFDPGTMQSRLLPGLFAAGEVLDVYGDCGGYNLHWAWATGILAGKAAALR